MENKGFLWKIRAKLEVEDLKGMKNGLRRVALAALVLTLLGGAASALCFTDAAGRAVEVESPERVVSLYNSYGAAWLYAGGELAGGIADNDGAALPEGVQDLGSHVSPNMELLFALDPDFVLLSADVASHGEIASMLEAAEVPCAFFSTPDYESYMDMMAVFTQLTGREDIYLEQEETLRCPIEEMIARAQSLPDRPSALLIRANSYTVKCKGSEGTVAGEILRDMGFVNLADGNGALCESIGMEQVMVEDPDYIFAVLQGANSTAAENNLAAVLTKNPAWGSLTAVREGRFYVLDRELFHYHPNEKWAQAYAFILDIREGESR